MGSAQINLVTKVRMSSFRDQEEEVALGWGRVGECVE